MSQTKLTKRTSIGKSGLGQLMAMLESRQRDMRDKDETVEKIISSVQTASSLHNAKKKSLETETALLNSILNDIDAMNTFLKSIILIENLFNQVYQPHKKEQEQARAQYAPDISKYENKPKAQNKTQSFVELIFGGQTHVSSLQQWLDKVVKVCDAQGIKIKSNTGSKVKQIERSFYKAFYVYDCNNDGFKDITDMLRCSLVFETFGDLYKCFTVIETLSEQTLGGILRVKDRFHPQQMPFGYRDLMINILCPNSTEIVCELQLQFAPFYEYKKVSHKMYKLARLFEVEDQNLAYNYAVQYLRPKLGSFEVYKLTKEDMDDDEKDGADKASEMSYRELLTSWGLSQYIAKMEEEGWDDPTAWSELTEEDLKNDMGFKKGHIRKFNKQYKEWSQLAQIQKDDNKEESEEDNSGPTAIPIKIHSFRAHKANPSGFHSLHPSNVLNDNETIYASEISGKFRKNENDWMIFECSNDKLYVPIEICIRNRAGTPANRIKSFSVSVGNSESKKWIQVEPKCMEMKNNSMNQSFKIRLDSNSIDVIKKNKFNQYKLEFVENVSTPP
eukprot:105517_1